MTFNLPDFAKMLRRHNTKKRHIRFILPPFLVHFFRQPAAAKCIMRCRWKGKITQRKVKSQKDFLHFSQPTNTSPTGLSAERFSFCTPFVMMCSFLAKSNQAGISLSNRKCLFHLLVSRAREDFRSRKKLPGKVVCECGYLCVCALANNCKIFAALFCSLRW